MLIAAESGIPEISGLRFWAVSAIGLATIALTTHALWLQLRLLAALDRLSIEEVAQQLKRNGTTVRSGPAVEAVIRGNLGGSAFLLLIFGSATMTLYPPFVALGAVGVAAWAIGAASMRTTIAVSTIAERVQCEVRRRWGWFANSHHYTGLAPATFCTLTRSDSEGPIGRALCLRFADGCSVEVLPPSRFAFMWKPMLSQQFVDMLSLVLNYSLEPDRER